MRLNANTIICGDKVILVPYREEHVKTYHEWMKSPELLELTASEPLSFEEELDMQRKWRDDDDKLTFILLARPDDIPAATNRLLSPAEVARCRMVGDVNIFMPNGPQDDIECEIMIAEQEVRRQGLAREALTMFMNYVVRELAVAPTSLIAKISSKNTASIRLFESLGFGRVKLVEVWDELEMRWGWTGSDSVKGSTVQWPSLSLDGRIGMYDASS
ncbi:uncharacterized protein EHS24_004398 [Apiotrichum porosum]|uniref:N-acetyltransferase 9-like protein n=1 Tax=Apiotrichum porosum TaxID=105984 RepID=A0A427Y508_9TREE|nr:uncharacterized protein EHS24_004398 [Apiotrichum porosum]RSH86167.1 hypothetical protein EHS24_004398 [Apiotrichum porosum]